MNISPAMRRALYALHTGGIEYIAPVTLAALAKRAYIIRNEKFGRYTLTPAGRDAIPAAARRFIAQEEAE